MEISKEKKKLHQDTKRSKRKEKIRRDKKQELWGEADRARVATHYRRTQFYPASVEKGLLAHPNTDRPVDTLRRSG